MLDMYVSELFALSKNYISDGETYSKPKQKGCNQMV